MTQRETYLLDTNSIDRVKRELERGNDDVAMWSDTEFAGAFDPTDDARVFTVYTDIMEWIGRQERFLSEARAEAAEEAGQAA